jgi:hypothetical protein
MNDIPTYVKASANLNSIHKSASPLSSLEDEYYEQDSMTYFSLHFTPFISVTLQNC